MDRGGDALTGGFLTGVGGFCFSVDLPEGNHEVTVKLGDPMGVSDTTIKVESRRLMLEHVVAAQAEQVTRKFTVNVHRPDIKGANVWG